MDAAREAWRAVELEVMNIERFATHDGPGIRTTVFLKGCPLRCPWCANPETQSMGTVLFHDAERCAGCGMCAQACATGAISVGSGPFSFDAARCTECGACVRACLHEALEFQGGVQTVGEVVDLCQRDRDYYEASGGGVTLSGGEPLLRVEEAEAYLLEARAAGLTTAVETTGNVPSSTIERLEPAVDYFLYDLKHIDDDRLREVAGGNGTLIKRNLQWLAERVPEKINVRIPVIPGFNFERETLEAMISALCGWGVRRVNLLPYHVLGKNKYARLGRAYVMPGESMRDEELEPYHRYALALGMESKIGA